MASSSTTKSLKESGARSKGITSKAGSSTTPESNGDSYSTSEHTTLALSSEAILEPSKDEYLKTRPTLWKQLTRSLQVTPSETTPVVSHVPNEHDSESVEEGDANCCCIPVYSCYENSVVRFRNSAFMFIIQLVFTAIPVSAFAMGLLFIEKCPKAHYLPVFGAVLGVMGTIFMIIWMFVSYCNRRGMPCSNGQRLLFGIVSFLVLVSTIVDAVFVLRLSPSFDPTSHEYCNETFYTFAFYKEIATAVVVILSAILYLPGSRHVLCCHDCSMRSTRYVSL